METEGDECKNGSHHPKSLLIVPAGVVKPQSAGTDFDGAKAQKQQVRHPNDRSAFSGMRSEEVESKRTD